MFLNFKKLIYLYGLFIINKFNQEKIKFAHMIDLGLIGLIGYGYFNFF